MCFLPNESNKSILTHFMQFAHCDPFYVHFELQNETSKLINCFMGWKTRFLSLNPPCRAKNETRHHCEVLFFYTIPNCSWIHAVLLMREPRRDSDFDTVSFPYGLGVVSARFKPQKLTILHFSLPRLYSKSSLVYKLIAIFNVFTLYLTIYIHFYVYRINIHLRIYGVLCKI